MSLVGRVHPNSAMQTAPCQDCGKVGYMHGTDIGLRERTNPTNYAIERRRLCKACAGSTWPFPNWVRPIQTHREADRWHGYRYVPTNPHNLAGGDINKVWPELIDPTGHWDNDHHTWTPSNVQEMRDEERYWREEELAARGEYEDDEALPVAA